MPSAVSPDQKLDPIQMLWVRGPLSRLEHLSLRSFLAQGHPIHLYTYAAPPQLPTGVRVFDASSIVPANLAPGTSVTPFAKGSMGAFSDYFRYQLMLQLGGWWADLDVIALRPFLDFPPIVLASTDEPPHAKIANGFVMRFTPGHAVPAACLAAINSRDLAQLDISQTGPLLLHKILGPEGRAAHCQTPDIFSPVPWNASQLLIQPRCAYLWDNVKHRLRRPHLAARFTPNTAAIHLWNETWRHAGLDKNALYPASSLYERLHRRYPPAPQEP